jgi:hypothetical protein
MTTTTAQQVSTTFATRSSDERRTFPRALIIALIALAALTIAAVIWELTATTTTTPVQDVPKAAADQLAPYRPGGSVYQQQVPGAAADQLAPYRPGGSVYQQQVPQAAD